MIWTGRKKIYELKYRMIKDYKLKSKREKENGENWAQLQRNVENHQQYLQLKCRSTVERKKKRKKE